METPMVSIVIPVYNGSDYLGEAIDSALHQTYDNIETIVVNDGSTDEGRTRRVAMSFGSRIRYFEKANGGVGSALNLGIKEMSGQYFSWLSHDDVFEHDKTERQIAVAKAKSADVVYSKFIRISASGEVIDAEPVPDEQFRYLIILQLLSGYSLNGCTMLIRRDAFDDVGLFREDLPTTQDYDMWIRMANGHRFIFTDHVVLRSRMHEKQTTRTHRNHFHECAVFYDSSVRAAIEMRLLGTLSEANVRFLAESLFERGYLSAAARTALVLKGRLNRVRLLSKIFTKGYIITPGTRSLRRVRKALYRVFKKLHSAIS